MRSLLSLLSALLFTSNTYAADVGEIAILEDTGGQIQDIVLIGSRYLERAACVFYQTHDDQYDVLFIWSAIPLNGFTRTQEGWALRSAAMGIGRDIYFDTTSRFCTAGRLRHAVKMGDIGSFGDDPDAIYTGLFGFTLSGVELMGHEFGHYWLAAVTFDRGDARRRCVLRGFNPPSEPPLMEDCEGYRNSDFNPHWSYYFNSGSVMYGNTIEDLGGGQFLFSNAGPKYSELDQYLMGLRDPAEVAPMFLVDLPLSAESTAFPLPAGQTEIVEGERIDFTVEDVIRAEGPRVPAREGCHWKAAFAIVHEEGSPPSPAEIARVDAYRRRWEEFYAGATDRRGSFDTTLAGTGNGTTECPAIDVPPPPDAGTVSADASAPAPDAEAAMDAGAAAEDASEPDPIDASIADTSNDDVKVLQLDGCDCSAAAVPSRRAPWPSLALLVLLFARCRRRRDPAALTTTGA